MKYLLDTHVWIWAVNDNKKLPKKYRKILSRSNKDEIALLDISIWEAGRVHRSEQLTNGDARVWFALAVENITVLSITPAIALLEQSLNWSHRDPADRLIASCALINALPLMTVDNRFHNWGGVKIV